MLRRGASVFTKFADTTTRNLLDAFVKRPQYPVVGAETVAGIPEEQLAEVIGVVSATGLLDPRRSQFIVQDETGGVIVDDPDKAGDAKDLQVGEKVGVMGKVRLWQGLRVVFLDQYVDRIAKGGIPKAVPLTLEQIGPEWSGFRVLLKDLQWAEKQPAGSDRARVSDGRGHEIELRAARDASILADRSAKRFDLLGIVFVTEQPGKPGQPGEPFVVPLEIREAK